MRALFCSISTPGLLYPAIGMALELQKRGHEVAFVTDSAHTAFLAEHGLERIARGLRDGPSFAVAQWGMPLAVAIQLKHIEYAMAQFQPDILIGQPLTLGAYLAHERYDIPLLVQGLLAYLWPPSSEAAHLPDEHMRLRAWRYQDQLHSYNEVRPLFGLMPLSDDINLYPFLGNQFLLQSIPALYSDSVEFPAQVELVGSCLWEPESHDDQLTAWREKMQRQGRTLIYAQHARTFDLPRFWARLVQITQHLPIAVVASTGRLEEELGELPANMFARPHINQGSILPYCNAVIANGTSTIALGALTHGLPMLLLPTGGEQLEVAELCRAAGCALVIEADSDMTLLTSSIVHILEDSTMRSQAHDIAVAYASAGGCSAAAELIEQSATNCAASAIPAAT